MKYDWERLWEHISNLVSTLGLDENGLGTSWEQTKNQKKSLPPRAPAHTPKKTERKILSLLVGSMKFLF